MKGNQRPITVIGAGFSGLVSAFYLNRSGFDVTLIEAKDRAGGLISTHRLPQGLVESAANGLLNSTAVEELFAALEIPLIGTVAQGNKRYIFKRGRPRRWPLGLLASLRLIFLVLKYFTSKELLSPKRGESVRDWAYRVMGKQLASYTAEAALQGIYAGDPNRLSASLIFGRFFTSAKNQESTLKAKRPSIRGTVSAPEGMGQLIDALRSYLEKNGVKFIFSQEVELASQPDHPLVVATSAPAASGILAAVSPQRAQALSKIEMLPIVTCTAFFEKTDPWSQGFGCLFPPVENRRVLGVLKNNFIFQNRVQNGFSETWILGGASSSLGDLAELTDQEILNIVHEERMQCFSLDDQSYAWQITRWPKALPHYTVELEKALEDNRLLDVEDNIVLIGNYLGQIGLAKILDRAALLPELIDKKGQWKNGTF